MTRSDLLLNPAQAARKLGVSPKALRLYERHGLLRPRRNAAGWRFYGDVELARAGEIVALRALGMSLGQAGRVLAGDRQGLDDVLAAHQAALGRQMDEAGRRLEALRQLRAKMAAGAMPAGTALAALAGLPGPAVRFDLPWPWAGESFEIARLAPVTFLTGPLGSGKTRLAHKVAEAISGAVFSGLDRMEDDGARARRRLDGEPDLRAAVEQALGWLLEDGASESGVLLAALVALCDPAAEAVVMDLVEEGLDAATQEALGAWLRLYEDAARPLVVMTRSSAIVDLDEAAARSMMLYCPANHSPPLCVLPIAGAAGYEAVASCLAPPEVRSRTAGMLATMPGSVPDQAMPAHSANPAPSR